MTDTTFDDAAALAWYRARFDDDASSDELALARLAAWSAGRSMGPEIHEIPLRDGSLWPPPFSLGGESQTTATDLEQQHRDLCGDTYHCGHYRQCELHGVMYEANDMCHGCLTGTVGTPPPRPVMRADPAIWH